MKRFITLVVALTSLSSFADFTELKIKLEQLEETAVLKSFDEDTIYNTYLRRQGTGIPSESECKVLTDQPIVESTKSEENVIVEVLENSREKCHYNGRLVYDKTLETETVYILTEDGNNLIRKVETIQSKTADGALTTVGNYINPLNWVTLGSLTIDNDGKSKIVKTSTYNY